MDVYGTAGNDRLKGTAEDDLLDGGAGTDRLRGSFGNDTFSFHWLSGPFNSHVPDTGIGKGQRDIIQDFLDGDLIQLSGYNPVGASTVVVVPEFLGTEDFHDGWGLQVRVITEGNHDVIQISSQASLPKIPTAPPPANVIAEIQVAGHHSWSIADFLLL